MLTVATRRLLIGAFILVLLTLPLIAMQFTTEVRWTVTDFAVAAFLLAATGSGCELIMTRVKSMRRRLLICGLVLALLLVVWIQLAVGIID
ncbi:hypothetical protein DCC81_18020 [Chitinophaga parva]|uniref:Uncharacterized protein n=1 Tax=Chitinophaga parva TaxID=2169414 RepID=A0A2T7BIM3_9BACT|nr:hypothetical protein [Chitinophaga parva]PUZ26136.1 hypothetical protein DCC81_18020 [Chitinophaga parva]